MRDLQEVSKIKWEQLNNKYIYFGHQSVGFNIIDGMRIHLNDEIKLNIQDAKNLKHDNTPVFAHSQNGQNGIPTSKIDDFEKKMENDIGNIIDIAGFKFCYVDVDEKTDVEELFNYYKLKIDKLSREFPKITIIHFSVPLRPIQKGPKAVIKKWLGKSIGIEDNVARLKFNNLLKKEYGSKSYFDLAKYESTYPDGTREFTMHDGEKVYSLILDYTYDWGHLSEKGRDLIGMQFLIFLAEL